VKATLRGLLQEASTRGNAICIHPDITLQRSSSGILTGFHVCTVCKEVLRMSSMHTTSRMANYDEVIM
jgi:hypothetical protein